MQTTDKRRARNGRSERRPLRVLALAPGEPCGATLDLIGPHPLVACAAATRGRVVFTVVTDQQDGPRFASLSSAHELLVAPLWRLLPRDRLPALAAAARLQTALACLAALGTRPQAGACAAGGPPWDCVHGWQTGGALAAAAVARATGLAWAWTPAAGETDEHACHVAAWAAQEASLLLASDPSRRLAVRRDWAVAGGKIGVLPWLADDGWDDGAGGRPAAGLGRRLILLLGSGATAGDVTAVLRAVAAVQETPAAGQRWTVMGVGHRLGVGAAVVRREARRGGLLAGLVWRDLAPELPLPRAGRALGRADAAVVLGEEAPPLRLLGWLWRRGVPVILVGTAAAGAAPTAARAPALETCPPEAGALAACLARLGRERGAERRACRAAWRACADEGTVANAGRELAHAYARLARRAGHGGRDILRLPGRG